MIVKFRGYSFNTKHVEAVNVGGRRNRVKLSHYPGVAGGISMNMRTAERHIIQSGTIRTKTQATLISLQEDIESLCDGTLAETTATGLSAHGQLYNTIYADVVTFGPQFKATGGGSPQGTLGDYFGKPYTIDYIQTNP